MKKKNLYMITNNFMIWQMEDRGSHYEPAYHVHKGAVKWHSHYGHQTREMVQKKIDNQEVLGIGSLITRRPTHFSLLPGEWHCGLSIHQANIMASAMIFTKKHFVNIHKGQWFCG